MRRRPVVRSRQSRPSLFRPRGLRLEWLEDRTVPSGLTFSLADPTLAEGETTIGTVTRTGDLSQSGIVWLYTPNPLWANGPGPVIIPAGQASATFPVHAVDDIVPEGDLTTNLHAWLQTPSTSAYALLTVLDDDPEDPIAKADGYDVNEEEPYSTDGFSWGVLENDSSPNGALTASLVSGPSHGNLTLNPDGNFVYTPRPELRRSGFLHLPGDGPPRRERPDDRHAVRLGGPRTPSSSAPRPLRRPPKTRRSPLARRPATPSRSRTSTTAG